ncbi:response regulator [candidate division KSB1 bacterium]|nr:response regulator [candidate division KSB1 bacterium]
MKSHEKDKILIIDEDSNYIGGLRKSLNQAGYDVLSFDDPHKALEIIQDIHPQMIIADVDLTENADYSFFKHVQTIPELKNIPFIVMSNQKRVDDRIRTIELGVDDFISKPFYVEEVVARVENLFKEIEELQNHEEYSTNGFGGNLGEKNVIELIKTLESEKKNAIIHLKQGQFEGSIFVYQGNVHDAVFEDFEADEALTKLIVWTEGRYFIEYTDFNRPKVIVQPNELIIEFGRERIEQWDKIKYNLPPLTSALYITELTSTKNNISDDERKLISTLNGSKIIYEMVVQSPFDDIKALELIFKLYEKGYLKESDSPFSDEKKKVASLFKEKVNTPKNGDTSHLLHNLLQNNPQEPSDQDEDRRQDDRRQTDDRRKMSDRRRTHRIFNQKLFLNKTELMMIREKLL